MPPLEKTSTYERGTYYFFDHLNWRRVAKEFHLDYERLENRPATQAHFNNNSSSSGGTTEGGRGGTQPANIGQSALMAS